MSEPEEPKRRTVVNLHGRDGLNLDVADRLFRAKRKLVTDADPEAVFIDFPHKQDFEEAGSEYYISGIGENFRTIHEVGSALVRRKLPYLDTVRLAYLWKHHGGAHAGKAVLGRAKIANPLLRTFTDRLGFVILSADHFLTFKLTNFAVEALIYHELLHFRFDEGQLTTAGHDFEAFGLEVREYGMWKPDLRVAKESFDQLELL